jgi:hypothetical protein
MLGSGDGGISPEKSASVYHATARTGFRLSPSCSPIRYGLAFPRGYLFIGILNDKGRYRQLRRERNLPNFSSRYRLQNTP